MSPLGGDVTTCSEKLCGSTANQKDVQNRHWSFGNRRKVGPFCVSEASTATGSEGWRVRRSDPFVLLTEQESMGIKTRVRTNGNQPRHKLDPTLTRITDNSFGIVGMYSDFLWRAGWWRSGAGVKGQGRVFRLRGAGLTQPHYRLSANGESPVSLIGSCGVASSAPSSSSASSYWWTSLAIRLSSPDWKSASLMLFPPFSISSSCDEPLSSSLLAPPGSSEFGSCSTWAMYICCCGATCCWTHRTTSGSKPDPNSSCPVGVPRSGQNLAGGLT